MSATVSSNAPVDRHAHTKKGSMIMVELREYRVQLGRTETTMLLSEEDAAKLNAAEVDAPATKQHTPSNKARVPRNKADVPELESDEQE